jgi:hypothetical protein
MSHLILLGDSIFDNRAYVAGGPAVIDQVQGLLPKGWQASLLAVDGNVALNVLEQLNRIPSDATHLVISAGGNDALGILSQLHGSTPMPILAALQTLATIQLKFESEYTRVIAAAVLTGKPILACTIYDGVPGLSQELKSALSLFNDVILRVCARQGLPVLDLRALCNESSDYSVVSPIEPSNTGGQKIARRIVQIVMQHKFSEQACQLYV